MAPTVTSPWHAGELAVRERVGESHLTDRAAGAVHGTVPPVATEFLATQRVLVVAAADAEGRLWVTALHGEPGFLTVPRPDVLDVWARPAPGDPLARVLAGAANVGTIAIEPGTRRRTRLNGRSLPTPEGLHVQLHQVFANCPKYIQRRDIVATGGAAAPAPPTIADALDERQARWIASADTFFVGTTDASGDVDASHRGGNPGFVEVGVRAAPGGPPGRRHLRFPDYRGNSFYMTLGNLEQDPVIGLLFVDWASGSTLQVTGTAAVRYEPDGAGEAWPPGALRMVDVEVERVVELAGALPLRGGDAEMSRFNPV